MEAGINLQLDAYLLTYSNTKVSVQNKVASVLKFNIPITTVIPLCYSHHDFIIHLYHFIYLFLALYRPRSIV